MKTLEIGIFRTFFKSTICFIIICTVFSEVSAQATFTAGKYQLFFENGEYYDITYVDTIKVSTDYILIKLRDNITDDERDNFNSRYSFLVGFISPSGVTRYIIDKQTDFINLLEDLSIDEDVDLYDINHLIPLTDIELDRPNDSQYEIDNFLGIHPFLLWPYLKTNLFDAWNITTGSPDVTVAVIDDGLWIDHPDIGLGQDNYSNIWNNEEEIYYGINGKNDDECGYIDDFHGWNFTQDNADITNYYLNTHGIRMSGIISAKSNNVIGSWGTAGGYATPGVKIMMLKVNNDDGTTNLNTAFIPEAITYAVCHGVRIINMSFGWIGEDDNITYEINQAYEDHNTIFVSATGNEKDNHNVVNYPAILESVIAVAATQCNPDEPNNPEYRWETESNISQCGDEVEIAAPAAYIIDDAQWVDGHFESAYYYLTDKYNGSTSKATAFVSGVIALMLSEYPCLSNDEVRKILMESADKISGFTYINGRSEIVGYGRINALKALKLPEEPIHVNEEPTWTEDDIILDDLIIEDGGWLTIENCTISISHEARIIIQPGGKLTLDGCTITSLCDQMWPGIQVHGYANASQDANPCPQGQLIMKNGAIIENAVIAVDLWEPEVYSKTGGVIDADDAIFLNNANAVHALQYRNFNPDDPTQELDYRASFNNCSFIVDDYYLGDKTFYKHIDLDHVKGVKFYGCDFSLTPLAENVSEWNLGIAAYNAGFSVLPFCVNTTIPCEEYDSCRFEGFYWGIGLYSSETNIYPVSIHNAHFDDNNTGIFSSLVNNAIIIDNFFEVGKDELHLEDCGNANGLGIDMQRGSGFAIENNIFRKNVQAPVGIYAGIRVLNCPSEHDIVYRNEFVGLSYGNYAEGTNRSIPTDEYKGIEYQCNINENNAVDFIVTGPEPRQAMIRQYQGSKYIPCGNTFSATAQYHFFLNTKNRIDWYYGSAQNQIPDESKIYKLDEIYWEAHGIEDYNECPDHYGGGGHITLTSDDRLQAELDYIQNLSNYNSIIALYQSLIDGGDTESELTDIQSAQPDEMWDMRAQLLGDSPHLSQDVLRATADQTDVFPDNILLEILSANPDELSRDTLLNYLEQKENPLPGYMIEILREAANGVTYKTILEEDLAQYHKGKTWNAQEILRSILSDSIFTPSDYREWLDNLGGMEADKQIIASYLHENDTSDALALLNLVPSLYGLEGDELDEYNNYKTLIEMQISWRSEGRSVFDLDSAEIALLETLATDNKSDAGHMARNILRYGYNDHFCDCMQTFDSNFTKKTPGYTGGHMMEAFGPKISVNPNPAHNWVTFDFELTDERAEGWIHVYDVNGMVQDQFQVSGKKGQKVWDTRSVTPGLYYYSLTSDGISVSGKLIIQ